MAGLFEQVERALTALGVRANARVCVACSGGPDSAALADAVMALADRGRLGAVTLVHVDHRLRRGSADEAAVVERLARTGNAGFVAATARVDEAGASLERAAREARYRALDRAADDAGADWVLLAHTATDQAETVLMRILRGTGVTGLAAMVGRRGRYLRPLLAVSRAEVQAHVTARGLATVRDPMNEDHRFFRSRIRHRWMPALQAENPALETALCRLAGSAGAEREVLEWAAGALLERAGRAGWLDVAALREAPEPVRRRALAVAAGAAGGGPLEARHQRALDQLVTRPEQGTLTIDLPRVSAVREYGWLRFGDAEVPARPAIDVRGASGPYRVRAWRAGDRMCPARLRGRSRKLSDLYTDAKIPRRWREGARVVVRECDGFIEWAEHLGPSWRATAEVRLTATDPVASNKD